LGLGHTNAHIVKQWAEDSLPGWRLVCISNFPSATYSGMFPGTLAGQFEDGQFRIDLPALVKHAHAELVMAEVQGLDLQAGRLLLADHDPLPFDLLSIGVGSMPAGWKQYADCESVVPIKPMQNFQKRLEMRLETAAEYLESEGRQGRPIRIAIVGGGAASIEIALCLDQRLRTERRYLHFEIAIYSKAQRVCQDMRPGSITKIERILRARSIGVHYGQAVRHVEQDQLVTEDGQQHGADCVIWVTGAAAPPVLDGMPLQKDDRGFIAIGPTLQSLTDPRIFAVGDCGTMVENPFPKAGVYAVRQCPVLWHNLRAVATESALKEFRPQTGFLKLLNTGDGKALLEYGWLTAHAGWCWKLKTWIDQRFVGEFQVDVPGLSQDQKPPSHLPRYQSEGKGSGNVSDNSAVSGATSKSFLRTKLIILLTVAILMFTGWYLMGDQLSLLALTQRESQLTTLVSQHPLYACALAFAVYVVVTGLSLPGAAALSLVVGWVFGFWRALLIVSFASTLGATVAFLISRYLLRDWIQSRIGTRLQSINQAFEREGAYYLFTLRLIPIVPFFVINAAMGLTRIRARTFWWISQIGMLPGTVAYVYAGSVVPNVQTLAETGASGILDSRLLVAFAILGVLPITLKKLVGWVSGGRKKEDSLLIKQ